MNTNTVPVLLENITVGCRVMVCGAWGSEPAREAKVTDVSPDIKNGRPGIAYELKNGDTRWAYLNQVVAILPAPRYVEPAVSPEAAKRSAIWHNSL